ncbi:MAG: hypothetical protein HUU50_04095 [Candidatus Brocadiae bacterium]|nr:hypothetical protein [Candidatus Brocadiia bacterium]
MKKSLSFLFSFLVLSSYIFALHGISLSQVKFFNAGGTSPARNQRQYSIQFLKNDARYIWCELEVKNHLYNIQDQTHTVLWKYFNSDNTLRGQVSSEFAIKKEWTYSYISHGWGWEKPGNWPVGNYRVELWVSQEKFAESFFSIQNHGTIEVKRPYDIELEFVKLFEGNYDTKPDDNTPYTTTFYKSSTRYISFLVGAKNLLYNIQDQKPLVVGYYYREDGSFVGKASINIDVPYTWKHADFWCGWGWDKPGNWQVGRYRLDVYFGNYKVSETKFSVVY